MHINEKMREHIVHLLKTRIPEEYYYHNYEHTEYILNKVLEIGEHENCTSAELELLAVAALWHDVGYINVYQGHEEEGCRLAAKHLPEFGYPQKDIDVVLGMIMATKVPQDPKTKLESIIADADMEYLGTENPRELADKLYRELKTKTPELTREKWKQTEIDFIENHKYFTEFCRKNRQPAKEVYLRSLQETVQE